MSAPVAPLLVKVLPQKPKNDPIISAVFFMEQEIELTLVTVRFPKKKKKKKTELSPNSRVIQNKTHASSTPAYLKATQRLWQIWGVMPDCWKLAPVSARREPVVPSATHP